MRYTVWVTTYDSASDESLMQAYLSGEARAFDELYRRHAGRVYGYLRKRLPSAEEAEEVFQAVFLKAHRSRGTYQAKYPVVQWLFVIAKTSLVDHLRKSGRNEALIREEWDVQSTTVSQTDPDPSLSISEGPEEEILQQLPVEQKRVVEMRVFEEKDYSEIAKQLGRSQASVRQIYSRAIRRLRTLIASPHGGHRS